MNNGKLYIVATPIGNLEDITYRAIKILHSVDIIVCEDTRVTAKLCSRYEIDTQRISANHHANDTKLLNIIKRIEQGANIAYVSDAGTPGISDPGNQLVNVAIENNIQVVPIPGASAITSLVSIAGFNMQKFCFMAYPQHKKVEEHFLKKFLAMITQLYIMIVYTEL